MLARNQIMSIERSEHNRIPAGPSGGWYPLHGSTADTKKKGSPGCPDLVRLLLGTANPAEYSGSAFDYTFPVDNGTTNGVCWVGTPDDDALDGFDLADASVGNQIIVAWYASVPTTQSNNGNFWSFGTNTTNESLWGFLRNGGEQLCLGHRGLGAGAETTTVLTVTAGTGLSAGSGATWANQRIAMVASVTIAGALAVDVKVLLSNMAGSLTAEYTNAGLTFSGTARPGRHSELHPGLLIGARASNTSLSIVNYLGDSGATAPTIGNLCWARRQSYDAALPAAVLSDMLTRQHRYPRSLLLP